MANMERETQANVGAKRAEGRAEESPSGSLRTNSTTGQVAPRRAARRTGDSGPPFLFGVMT
ncbi:hypothetical protein HK28_06795 [Acetobacter sp. DsW_063]|nr:hypothetical protein HK28_06795 [Acetobacter sp. DsW_063]